MFPENIRAIAQVSGPVELRSGIHSNVYYDMDKILLRKDVADPVIDDISRLIPLDTVLLGVPDGGDRWARAISERFGSVIYIPSSKRGGIDKPPNVVFPNKITIIEDVVTTGGSSLDFIRKLVGLGATEFFLFAVLLRGDYPLCFDGLNVRFRYLWSI